MKQVLILWCALLPILSFAGGSGGGNGGDAVVCGANPDTMMVHSLDHYENALLFKRKVSLGDETLTYVEKVKLALKRLSRYFPKLQARLETRVDQIMSDIVWVDQELIDIPDSGDLMLAQGCHVEQLAIRVPNRIPLGKQYVVNKKLWDKLTVNDRAILILHEAIFSEFTDNLKHINSIASRYFNGLIFSKVLETAKLGSIFEAFKEYDIGFDEAWGCWISKLAQYADSRLKCNFSETPSFYKNGNPSRLVPYENIVWETTEHVKYIFPTPGRDFNWTNFYEDGSPHRLQTIDPIVFNEGPLHGTLNGEVEYSYLHQPTKGHLSLPKIIQVTNESKLELYDCSLNLDRDSNYTIEKNLLIDIKGLECTSLDYLYFRTKLHLKASPIKGSHLKLNAALFVRYVKDISEINIDQKDGEITLEIGNKKLIKKATDWDPKSLIQFRIAAGELTSWSNFDLEKTLFLEPGKPFPYKLQSGEQGYQGEYLSSNTPSGNFITISKNDYIDMKSNKLKFDFNGLFVPEKYNYIGISESLLPKWIRGVSSDYGTYEVSSFEPHRDKEKRFDSYDFEFSRPKVYFSPGALAEFKEFYETPRYGSETPKLKKLEYLETYLQVEYKKILSTNTLVLQRHCFEGNLNGKLYLTKDGAKRLGKRLISWSDNLVFCYDADSDGLYIERIRK